MTHLAFELRTSTPGSLIPALAERVEEGGYRSLWVNHPPDEDRIGCLAWPRWPPRPRGSRSAPPSCRSGQGGYPAGARRLCQRHGGVGPAQIAELEGSAAFLRKLPAYAAHFRRSGISPEQTSIAAAQPGELPRLLGPWRDTVDEVVLVPVRADQAGPARDLVDAAIAGF